MIYESDPLRPSVAESMAQFAWKGKQIPACLEAYEASQFAA
jgi:hypothetical protein